MSRLWPTSLDIDTFCVFDSVLIIFAIDTSILLVLSVFLYALWWPQSAGVYSEGAESCSRPETGIVLPPVGSMDLEARSTWAVDWLPLPGQQPCKRV